MSKLNVLARDYLDSNGISITHFAKCIGCDRSLLTKWLNGQRELKQPYIKRIMGFLGGEYIVTVDKIKSD